ncbi:MAG: hypothetical protein QM704_14845 [Anaeromyxobacteraceae bacterium]
MNGDEMDNESESTAETTPATTEGDDWRAKPRGPRTSSPAGIRRAFGAAYRELCEIPAAELSPTLRIALARAKGDLLAKLAVVLRDADHEGRIVKLEEAMARNRTASH